LFLYFRLALLVILVFNFSAEIRGQRQHTLFSSNLMFEAKVHYGFLYPHHLELQQYSAHFPAYEISIQKITYGKQKWEKAFNYPNIGLTLFYCGLGNNPELGVAYALMPLINFPLLKNHTFTLGFRFALGIGYVTNRFDRLTNYKNLAIGSHFNAAVNLMIETRFRINRTFSISAGISLQHFSNGSLKLPNNGLNAPMANIGIAYRPFPENRNIPDRFYAPTEPYSATLQRPLEFNLGLALGWKNLKAVTGENYLVFHLYENTFVRLSKKSQFGIGFDLSYDPSQRKVYELYYIDKTGYPDTTITNLKFINPGVNAAYNLTMGKLGIILNFGYYLHYMKPTIPFYQKLSVQYNISDHIFTSVMLKVVWGRAEYIGWGFGYRFTLLYGRKTVR